MITLKVLIIGCLWSVVFLDGLRAVSLINWHFDIFLKEHWIEHKKQWNSGAPISSSEIIFFTIIISSFPMWIAGWYGLSMVKWKRLIKNIIFSPLYLYKKLTLKTKAPVVIKKKAITEEPKTIKKTPIIKKAPIKHPPLPSATLMQSNLHSPSTPTPSSPTSVATSSYSSSSPLKKSKEPSKPIDHALFNFDDEDFDLDFDFEKKENTTNKEDIPSALVVDTPPPPPVSKEKNNNKPQEKHQKPQEKPKKEATNKPRQHENNEKESHTPVMDVLTQKGYDIISSAIISNTTIDYIAVSKKELLLCLVDREVGDWLADEEKFNDEEPLWFSESSHRISPVRKIDLARDIIKTKLAIADFNFDIVSYVVIQSGNIINAEDMFDIWGSMNINVTRINRGSPKEIRLFSKSVENCEDKLDKNTFEKLKKLIYSMA